MGDAPCARHRRDGGLAGGAGMQGHGDQPPRRVEPLIEDRRHRHPAECVVAEPVVETLGGSVGVGRRRLAPADHAHHHLDVADDLVEPVTRAEQRGQRLGGHAARDRGDHVERAAVQRRGGGLGSDLCGVCRVELPDRSGDLGAPDGVFAGRAEAGHRRAQRERGTTAGDARRLERRVFERGGDVGGLAQHDGVHDAHRTHPREAARARFEGVSGRGGGRSAGAAAPASPALDQMTCSRRASPTSRARVRRAFWPVAMRSMTSPVNIALASDASTVATSGGTPSRTSRISICWRHNPIWSPRTRRGSPVTVASSAAASMPSRTIARLGDDAVIHRHHARSRSACDMPGLRSSQRSSIACCTRSLRRKRGDDQVVLRTEVVDERVDAHAERVGERSQRHVGEPVLGEVAHDVVEQAHPAVDVDEACHRVRLASGDPAGRAPVRGGRPPGGGGR